jgi:hypothetical protein
VGKEREQREGSQRSDGEIEKEREKESADRGLQREGAEKKREKAEREGEGARSRVSET